MAPYVILMICTGNICRSPAGERLLAGALGPQVEVLSAGTAALTGHPIAEPMQRRLRAAGADADGFAARRATGVLVRGADLVLTMTREHRADAVQLWPAAVRRTFTLLEFVRLLGAADRDLLPESSVVERLRTVVDVAGSRREPIASPADDDISDPYRRSEGHYDTAFTQIRGAAAELVAFVS